jgi:dTDP-glucose pyrophosphorylase
MSGTLNEILLQENSSVRDALRIIQEGQLRFAVVTDDNMNLVGVVTDGDIRRALLLNISLDDSVDCVMNKNPLTLQLGASRKEAVELMQRKDILAIPIVSFGKCVGLESIQIKDSKRRYENPVFLMAGGFGSRLWPLTKDCPKPLLKVGDKPILESVLNSFIASGFVNFFISTHYFPEMIKEYFGDGSKWNVSITYTYEEAPLGTGGALGLLPKTVSDLPLILMNGDLLTTVDFEKVLEFHNKGESSATLCVREYEHQVPFGVINGDGTNVSSMEEKPVQRFFVNAGIYVISSELRKTVMPNEYLDMPTLLQRAIDGDKAVSMFPIYEYWLDIGRLDDYDKAQRDFNDLGLLNA